ncbi:hypothetical protein [Chryseobacterium proteolyticum]|uniref:hypothetical protein n=1 Tax=Chryseobacterium proteolyticum TaxID=118127 RepID=UPI003983B4E9
MKNILLLSILLTIPGILPAQEGNIPLAAINRKYNIPYKELKGYDGLYEYVSHSTLKIAASPQDLFFVCYYQREQI